MIVDYYSVEDVVAKQFGPLFPARNDEVAKRMFRSLLKDVEPQYWKDYFLHHVFQWDDEYGNVGILSLDEAANVLVCSGEEFLEVNK